MLRLGSVAKSAVTVAGGLEGQKRGHKDGKRAQILSWSGFTHPRLHGGAEKDSQAWMLNGPTPRRPGSYTRRPVSTKRARPHLDPFVFKYVGVKTDARGRPIMDASRKHRESEIRHEFRSLLTERNFHGFPLLYYQAPRPHDNVWNATEKWTGV
eukprot:TRINITY_DN9671_c1_g1_i2.p1 TRINITY_DN9671_c1_g1~~TRINITY_DN9671_c1_g1_i2.p1  ORF type:complete len:154 (+),score=9.43 TRINITY_DN9671_c1_g1_i2:223-684(+)